MNHTIDVPIPLEPDVARALEIPGRREAAGRVLSGLLKGGRVREARANGLTDEDIDAELEAWRTERDS